jgi:hypothetical protein
VCEDSAGLGTESMDVMTERERRMVENEQLFRKANDRLHERIADDVAPEGRVPFLCECTNDTCMGRVELTLDEYARVRGGKNHFVLVPGHPMMERERLVSENERFWVVEKPE